MGSVQGAQGATGPGGRCGQQPTGGVAGTAELPDCANQLAHSRPTFTVLCAKSGKVGCEYPTMSPAQRTVAKAARAVLLAAADGVAPVADTPSSSTTTFIANITANDAPPSVHFWRDPGTAIVTVDNRAADQDQADSDSDALSSLVGEADTDDEDDARMQAFDSDDGEATASSASFKRPRHN